MLSINIIGAGIRGVNGECLDLEINPEPHGTPEVLRGTFNPLSPGKSSFLKFNLSVGLTLCIWNSTSVREAAP